MTTPVACAPRVPDTRLSNLGAAEWVARAARPEILWPCAAVLAVGVLGLGRPTTPPVYEDVLAHAAAKAAPVDEVLRVYAGLASTDPKIATDAKLAEAVALLAADVAAPEARGRLYRELRRLGGERLEPLMWVLAARETDPAMRALAYEIVPKGSLRDTGRLLAAAQHEALVASKEPLVALVPALVASSDPRGRAFVASLARLEDAPDPRRRAELLPMIHRECADDAETVRLIDAALGSSDEVVRVHAALARGQARGRRALETAVALLASRDPAVVLNAAVTIERYGEPHDVQALLPCFESGDAPLITIAKKAFADRGIPVPAGF